MSRFSIKKSKLLVAVLFWSSWTQNCKNSKTMKIPSFLDIYRFALFRWQSFRHCCILLRVQVFVVKNWVFLQPLNHYSVFVRAQIGLDLDFFQFFFMSWYGWQRKYKNHLNHRHWVEYVTPRTPNKLKNLHLVIVWLAGMTGYFLDTCIWEAWLNMNCRKLIMSVL